MSKKINVLVVDDSAFMRKVISDFINGDERLQVIDTARNGEEAIRKIAQRRPDVVTLDIEMPVMDGLEALQKVMENDPLPVIMLSSTTQRGAENAVLSIQYGAIDFVAKPSGAISLDLHKVQEEIVHKIILASKANLKGITHPKSLEPTLKSKPKLQTAERAVKQVQQPFHYATRGNTIKKLVCIGTSTGGPRALQQVLTGLPKDTNAPILIVQHMPAGFTKSLAQRLNTLSQINVKEAEEGDILQKGTAYIAPGGYHLKVKSVGANVVITLDQSEPRNGHRPAVDVMFESISLLSEFERVAVIMTGMGSDGSKGLEKLKATGKTYAIAESEESSIVYGMPKTAVATNLVDEVVHLNKISRSIINSLN